MLNVQGVARKHKRNQHRIVSQPGEQKKHVKTHAHTEHKNTDKCNQRLDGCSCHGATHSITAQDRVGMVADTGDDPSFHTHSPRAARGAVMALPLNAEGVTNADAAPRSTTRRKANSFIFAGRLE